MTTHVMRLVANAWSGEKFTKPTWLRTYDPSTPDGFGLVTGTERYDEALRGTVGELTAMRNAVSTTLPKRPDGEPNRPLSAFHIMLEPV